MYTGKYGTCLNLNCPEMFLYITLENNPKQIQTLIGLKPCFYLTIRLFALDFYRMIVDEGAARVISELPLASFSKRVLVLTFHMKMRFLSHAN